MRYYSDSQKGPRVILNVRKMLLICAAGTTMLSACADRAATEDKSDTTETFIQTVGDRGYSESPRYRTSIYISNSGAIRFKSFDCAYAVTGQIQHVQEAGPHVRVTYSEIEIYRLDNAWQSDTCRKFIDDYRATLPKTTTRVACSYSPSRIDFNCDSTLPGAWVQTQN